MHSRKTLNVFLSKVLDSLDNVRDVKLLIVKQLQVILELYRVLLSKLDRLNLVVNLLLIKLISLFSFLNDIVRMLHSSLSQLRHKFSHVARHVRNHHRSLLLRWILHLLTRFFLQLLPHYLVLTLTLRQILFQLCQFKTLLS